MAAPGGWRVFKAERVLLLKTFSEMLTSHDLRRGVIRPKGVNYLGDYPIDRLPKVGGGQFAFIANTAPSWESGTHWFAVVQPPSLASPLLILDPLGLPLDSILPPLRWWIGRRRVVTLPFPIQPLNGTSCGAFCLYLLEKLPLYNYDINRLVFGEFSEDDTYANHNKVFKWWLGHATSSPMN